MATKFLNYVPVGARPAAAAGAGYAGACAPPSVGGPRSRRSRAPGGRREAPHLSPGRTATCTMTALALKGKTAIVTGGRRSIGRGIALALAEAGADVAVNDLQEDDDARETLRLIRVHGRRAAFYAADVTDSAAVGAMFDQLLVDFGKVDILVNNPFFVRLLSRARPRARVQLAVPFRAVDFNLPGIVYRPRAVHSLTSPRTTGTGRWPSR
eukprot:SAG22_NODE_96_length_20771_cov_33.186018_17_plen_211_part_00